MKEAVYKCLSLNLKAKKIFDLSIGCENFWKCRPTVFHNQVDFQFQYFSSKKSYKDQESRSNLLSHSLCLSLSPLFRFFLCLTKPKNYFLSKTGSLDETKTFLQESDMMLYPTYFKSSSLILDIFAIKIRIPPKSLWERNDSISSIK